MIFTELVVKIMNNSSLEKGNEEFVFFILEIFILIILLWN